MRQPESLMELSQGRPVRSAMASAARPQVCEKHKCVSKTKQGWMRARAKTLARSDLIQ